MASAPPTGSVRIARRDRIRSRAVPAGAMAFNAMALSREQALTLIQDAADALPLTPEVQRLVDVFQITGEELGERGLPYETLKALECRHPLLFCLVPAL